MKVGFVSLGCSKNLVDTEMAISIFKDNGYEIVNEVNEAKIIVINTCGFIKSAKEEAINTIIEMGKYKENGKCKYLIVMGCLSQRYYEDLKKELPEVDAFIKIDEYDKFWEKIVKAIRTTRKKQTTLSYMNRVIATGNKTAYIKIAEGCDNNCTYCAIPSIRGKFKSREFEDIIEEAKILAEKGYQELILIAQDTTRYGIDLNKKNNLSTLLREITKIEGVEWVRFLYSYPEAITDELIEEVKTNDKICKYFDMPIQHISDNILKKMNRRGTKKDIVNVIEKIRANIPESVIRTTLIVGFPGESKEDFQELYRFIKETKFDKLGVFTYSKEEGTPSAKFDKQIYFKVKKTRQEMIMKEQKQIAIEKARTYIGENLKVIIDKLTDDGNYYIARSYMDAPEVDYCIYIKRRDTNKNLTGEFINCLITDNKNYDLIGEII